MKNQQVRHRAWLLRGTAVDLAFPDLTGAAACGKDSPTGPTTPDTRLDITNGTNVSVFFVLMRDCGATDWGPDLLGANVIPAGVGQSFVVTPGCHDVRLETSPTTNSKQVWLNVSFPAGQVTARTVTAWTPSQ